MIKYKDKITNFCAFVTISCTGILGLNANGSIYLGNTIKTALFIAPVVALAVTQVLTGKTPKKDNKDE